MADIHRADSGLRIWTSRSDRVDNTCLSISLWETHDQAKAASPVAESWVKENLSDRVALRSNYVGDLAFFQPERVTV